MYFITASTTTGQLQKQTLCNPASAQKQRLASKIQCVHMKASMSLLGRATEVVQKRTLCSPETDCTIYSTDTLPSLNNLSQRYQA
jgi:hypothetical protein